MLGMADPYIYCKESVTHIYCKARENYYLPTSLLGIVDPPYGVNHISYKPRE